MNHIHSSKKILLVKHRKWLVEAFLAMQPVRHLQTFALNTNNYIVASVHSRTTLTS